MASGTRPVRKRYLFVVASIVIVILALTVGYRSLLNLQKDEFNEKYMTLAHSSVSLYMIMEEKEFSVGWIPPDVNMLNYKIALPVVTDRGTIVGAELTPDFERQRLIELDFVSGRVSIDDASFSWARNIVAGATGATVFAGNTKHYIPYPMSDIEGRREVYWDKKQRTQKQIYDFRTIRVGPPLNAAIQEGIGDVTVDYYLGSTKFSCKTYVGDWKGLRMIAVFPKAKPGSIGDIVIEEKKGQE